MCGIAGIISSQKGLVNRTSLQRMSDALAHRGPDGEGFYLQESAQSSVGMAHRRLAIIDLSEQANQPFIYLNRYVVVHNGEIYNYQDLKKDLTAKGYKFQSNGDAEIIAASYHHYRENCLQLFDGMFAFALWDQETETLFCARDRFGEKPFYYYLDEAENTFFFASEMKGLWAAGVEKKIKPQLFLHFLTLGITQHPQIPELSFYENIYQLPPASFLQFNTNKKGVAVSHYWDLDKVTVLDISEVEAVHEFQRLFDASIQRRLLSDVPIGTSLSGGLDSSSIIASCAGKKGTRFTHKCFSAIFPGFSRDESDHIQLIKEKYLLDAHYTSPDAGSLINHIQTLAQHQEEPFSSSSVFAQYAVYALSKENNIKVLLDGQGADETLAGYTKYTHWYLQECLAKKQFSKAKKEAISLTENGFLDKWGLNNYLASFFPGITAVLLERKAKNKHYSDPYINKVFRDTYSGGGFEFKPVVEKLNDILYYDACMGSLQTLLRYADRNAMAHGIEVRLPFLQHELVSFIFSLPSELKFKNGFSKWILRESYRSSLPVEISFRKGKTGFEPPQKNWMQDETVQVQISLARQKLVDAGMLNTSVLKKPFNPQTAYASENEDWRHWNASLFL
jgi:asparagine synthase (glutamine-hydrolysing)